MQRILLLYQSEGASLLQRDLAGFNLEVQAAPLAEAETAMALPNLDAMIVEAPARAEDARRLIDTRPGKLPFLMLLRPDQVTAFDPTWPVDDFLVVPVAPEELLLRLRRVIFSKTGIDDANSLRSGDLLLDLANYKVFVGGQTVNLTFKEFELLRFLMTNRGKVFTREALLNRVWGYEYYGGARTVDVHIRRLRSKIETGTTIYIETVRNVGYRFPAD
jgi:DNA-binding response OmpR family regulator